MTFIRFDTFFPQTFQEDDSLADARYLPSPLLERPSTRRTSRARLGGSWQMQDASKQSFCAGLHETMPRGLLRCLGAKEDLENPFY